MKKSVPKKEDKTVTAVPATSPIFDSLKRIKERFGMNEWYVLTVEQSKINPFDIKTQRYQWLARTGMMIVSEEDLDKLEEEGYIIHVGESKIYGSHTIIRFAQ